MKRFSKVLALLLLTVLVMSFFGACGKKDEDAAVSSGSAEDAISTADVSFVDAEGESVFRVIRPSTPTEAEGQGATAIFKKIKDICGVSPKNTSDEEDAGEFAEILIGNTNREESKTAYGLLSERGTDRYMEYLICTINNDIVIVGKSDDALTQAVEYFCNNYISSSTVTGGINHLVSDPSQFSELTLFGSSNLSAVKVVRPIYNVSYITQQETDKLIDKVLTKTGYKFELVNDTVASNYGNKTDGSGTLTKTEPSEYEIIIGNCDRDGVNTIADYDTYEIRIEDKKIYLNGGSPYATAMAVSEFIKLTENNSTVTSDMAVIGGDYNAAVSGYNTAEYYVPTWRDDFDGDDFDYTKWNVKWDTFSGYSTAANGKAQYRGSSTLKNNYVKNGKMYQEGVETDTAYYGGLLMTQHMMEYRYGYLEISTLHPKGMGFWTALWTTSDNGLKSSNGPIIDETRMFYSETDVEECFGEGSYVMGNTYAWATQYGVEALNLASGYKMHVQNRHYSEDDRGFWMDFHTFGYEWLDNTRVRFTCDGKVYADQQLREGYEQSAYAHPAFLRLSFACGSGNHGEPTTDPEAWSNTNKYIVDWVHIYQKDGQNMWTCDKNLKWTQIR